MFKDISSENMMYLMGVLVVVAVATCTHRRKSARVMNAN